MNLYLFPQAASLEGGYGIAVDLGYQILRPQKEDIVLWYTNRNANDILHYRNNDIILQRFGHFSYNSFLNIARGRVRSEVSVSQLEFLKQYKFDLIHCDDVIFYRAIRKLFPDTPLQVRFHNCFSRIYFRNMILQEKLGYAFEITLKCELRLERMIFKDANVRKVFLSKEDCDFYTSMMGTYSDADIWPFKFDVEEGEKNRKVISPTRKLVWFGGLNSHKTASVRWFLNEVLPTIKDSIPDVEVHLYGAGTKSFDNPQNKVFGHGFYHGEDVVPSREALYINPDIVGGGVKLKLLTYYNAGVPFITSFFGYEGYDKSMIDNQYCIVAEKKDWANRIITFLRDGK